MLKGGRLRRAQKSVPSALFLAVAVALAVLAPSVAAAIVAETDPRLSRYNDFRDQVIPKDIDLYSAAFEACADCVPFVVYCTREIRDVGDLKGLKIRARDTADAFFARHSGLVSQLLPADVIGMALEAGIIDCFGFGGEKLPTAIADDPGATPDTATPGGPIPDFSSF